MLWAILGSWITVGIVVPVVIGIGVGVMSMTPPDFVVAKGSFCVAALVLAARVAWWLATELPPDTPRVHAVAFALFIFGGIGGLWMSALVWVDGRRILSESGKKTSASQPMPETKPSDSVKFPASVRIKYSSRQVLQVSNVPGDYNKSLNLDNVASLFLTAPFNREMVTLMWPTSPQLVIAEPRADERYRFPGDAQAVQVPQAGHGVEMRGLTLTGEAKRITFDSTHSFRLVRVGERIFRISLEVVRDKANAERQMFLEYEFAISEVDQSAETLATAITQEPSSPKYSARPPIDPRIEKLLAAMNTQPIGTIELRLSPVVNGQPNVVRLSSGTKSFVFDPVTHRVEFHMLTSAGKPVDLHLPLERTSSDGRYFVVFVWNIATGARLHVNDKFVSDGL